MRKKYFSRAFSKTTVQVDTIYVSAGMYSNSSEARLLVIKYGRLHV
jgi:hypothetical protein